MTDNLVVFLALFVVITLASILFTWIYNNTNGNVLAAILTHISMNWSCASNARHEDGFVYQWIDDWFSDGGSAGHHQDMGRGSFES